MTLVVPTTPTNLRLSRRIPIDSDVFNICDRVKEVDPNLYVYALDPPVRIADKVYRFSIAEVCADGVERLVYRVEALDARVIERLEYMLRVPFSQRFAELERLEAKWADEAKEDELNELVERVGLPMRRQLEHDGFITHRGTSYAKRGVNPR